jgi:hypothetical protein
MVLGWEGFLFENSREEDLADFVINYLQPDL